MLNQEELHSKDTIRQLNLGDLGCYYNIPVLLVAPQELEVGDAVYSFKQGYHGIVRLVSTDRVVIHWYKWDPRIEMPMMEDFWFNDTKRLVWRVEDYALAMVLDLKSYERGGPYN